MSYFSKTLVFAVLTACSVCADAEGLQKAPPKNPSDRIADVVHVAGLTEVKPDVKGSLVVTADDLIFSNEAVRANIPRIRIMNVFVGDQRTEPWGTTGKVVRKVIPYGGGATG
jgi:hypothetical protein